jgi:large subunit ribosomal protein L25
VPVHFINQDQCAAFRQGGSLEIVRHSVEVKVRADHIPEDLIVDLAGHKLGDTIRWSDLKGTKDVEPTITDRDFVIASIKTSSAAISAAADAAHDTEVAAEVEATEQAEAGEAASEDTAEG